MLLQKICMSMLLCSLVSIQGAMAAAPQANACGFFLGGGILTKWRELGADRGVLRCAAGNEAEAGRSPKGTIGKWAPFREGLIVWHGNGPRSGQTFEVHGSIGAAYQRGGGTASALGFPISDEYEVPGGRRNDFEGGSIVWTRANGAVQVLAAGTPTPAVPGAVAAPVTQPPVQQPGGGRPPVAGQVQPAAGQAPGGALPAPAAGPAPKPPVALAPGVLVFQGLKQTDPYDKGKRFVAFDGIKADTTGGTVVVRALDDGSCAQGRGVPGPAMFQRFRYTWRFDQDVSRLAIGQKVAVTFKLEGDQQPCLNQNPFMVLVGGDHLESPESAARFYFDPTASSGAFHVGGQRRINVVPHFRDTGEFEIYVTGLSGIRGMMLTFTYQYRVAK